MRLEKAGQSLVQRGPADPLRENMVDEHVKKCCGAGNNCSAERAYVLISIFTS